MPEKCSEEKMSALCEASGLVREIAAPATGKAALLRAYRRLGTWTYSRVKDVYYADRRIRISAGEMDALRAIVGDARKAVLFTELQTITGKTEATSDTSLTELRDQLAVVVRHLRAVDPTFRDPLVEALCKETCSACGHTSHPNRTAWK